MSGKRVLKVLFLMGVLTLVGAGQVMAQETTNGTLSVSARVVSHCIVNSPTLDFGTYDPMETAALNSSATITVRCTKGTPGATVQLGNGLHFSTTRRMQGPADQLGYDLYSDSGRTNLWLDTVSVAVASINMPVGQNIEVYGSIPPGQDVTVGAFTDSVVITVSF